MSDNVEIYSDGACRGNPGPGGWGTLLRFNGKEKEMFGAELETTNNRMELMAAIMGLEALIRPCKVQITTDSQYVKKGITEWLNGWKQRAWKTANKNNSAFFFIIQFLGRGRFDQVWGPADLSVGELLR